MPSPFDDTPERKRPPVSSLLVKPQPAIRLKQLREEAGLTQEALAKAAGLSVYAVSGYERGRFGMKVSALNRLSEALGKKLGRDSSLVLSELAQDHQS
jgi:transcriptional regulator with XRE-family HTH domain